MVGGCEWCGGRTSSHEHALAGRGVNTKVKDAASFYVPCFQSSTRANPPPLQAPPAPLPPPHLSVPGVVHLVQHHKQHVKAREQRVGQVDVAHHADALIVRAVQRVGSGQHTAEGKGCLTSSATLQALWLAPTCTEQGDADTCAPICSDHPHLQRALSEQWMPALAMVTVCCSITSWMATRS